MDVPVERPVAIGAIAGQEAVADPLAPSAATLRDEPGDGSRYVVRFALRLAGGGFRYVSPSISITCA